MLERFFVKPVTVDRIRACWLGREIEDYVHWLVDNRYAARNVFRRVPLLVALAEFTSKRNVDSLEQLSAVAESFVAYRCRQSGSRLKGGSKWVRKGTAGPISHFLEHLARRGWIAPPTTSSPCFPFPEHQTDYLHFLRTVRGLKESTIYKHRLYLTHFEAYLKKIHLDDLRSLTRAHLSAFITVEGRRRSRTLMQTICGSLRTFLRFLYLRGTLLQDLSEEVPRVKKYIKGALPRAITWEEVKKMLNAIDRRSPLGLRDHAVLLLAVTYGLRAREIAGLSLDDIDWKRDRLHVQERKAGHSTTYPLSPVVGEAILSYLRDARPQTDDRHLFLSCQAPLRPMTESMVSSRVGSYLRKTGLAVHRPGSHTLRHTCAARLIDKGFPLKEIGDYLAHSSPASTEVYAKIDSRDLREVSLSDGEEIL